MDRPLRYLFVAGISSTPLSFTPLRAASGIVPDPHHLVPRLAEIAILLDIDGTLLDFAPTPRDACVPSGLLRILNGLLANTQGALALVSGRSLWDIDDLFAPARFPAVAGHGAEIRVAAASDAVAIRAEPLEAELKRRLAAIAKLAPGILIEDKGYSLALHYRLAPQAEKAIYAAVSLIEAELSDTVIEVLPGKCVCEVKRAGFTKASGVRELMAQEPFSGRRPLFVGDDVTDESAFAIMPEFGGIAFSVGKEARGVAGHFNAPSDVREFLARLLDDKGFGT
jgi:trehalose 6-phosphate phosphatase